MLTMLFNYQYSTKSSVVTPTLCKHHSQHQTTTRPQATRLAMWADRERTSLSETARSCCDDNSEDNYNNDDHVTQTQAICTISAPMCNVSDLLATRNQIIHQDHYWAVSSSSPIFCIIYKKFHPSSPASHSPAGVRAAPGPSTGHSLPCWRLPPSDLLAVCQC